jgi:hypothetical protein
MPEGCYWDSNKAIGFKITDNSFSIHYILGLLNSSLYNFLAKGIVNNTNSIQLSGIHALPILIPDPETKIMVEKEVQSIIIQLKRDLSYNYEEEQKRIDDLIFRIHQKEFGFSETLKRRLDHNFSIYQ